MSNDNDYLKICSIELDATFLAELTQGQSLLALWFTGVDSSGQDLPRFNLQGACFKRGLFAGSNLIATKLICNEWLNCLSAQPIFRSTLLVDGCLPILTPAIVDKPSSRQRRKRADPALSNASPERSKRVVLRFLDILPPTLPCLDLGLGHQGAVLQAVRFFPRLDDVAMVCQSVEQGCSHLGVAKYTRPFGEAEIGGDDHASVLVQLGEQVEQQGSAALTER